VFTDIYNLYLTKTVISTCFKQTTIVPVPKNAKVTCLNDYCSIALKIVARKLFKRPSSQTPFTHAPSDPHAISTALSHLDKRNTYVRMLFIDYSSAFNTILSKLISKLGTLGLNISILTT
jgi:hypothetical protein